MTDFNKICNKDPTTVESHLNNSARYVQEVSDKEQNKVAVCSKCNVGIKWKQNMLRHKRTFHPELFKALQCEKCGKKFTSLQVLNEHQKHEGHQCTNGKRIEHANNLSDTLLINNMPHEMSKDSNKHVKLEPNDQVNKELATKDNDVINTYDKQNNLHITEESLSKPHHNIRLYKRDEQTALISIHNDKHSDKHDDLQPRAKRLAQNIIDKPFLCDKCQSRFRSKPGLRKHDTIIHAENKPFQCLVCEKKYAMRIQLRRHVKTHKNNKTCTEQTQMSNVLPAVQPFLEREELHKTSTMPTEDANLLNKLKAPKAFTDENTEKLFFQTKRIDCAPEDGVVVLHSNLINMEKQVGPATHEGFYSVSKTTLDENLQNQVLSRATQSLLNPDRLNVEAQKIRTILNEVISKRNKDFGSFYTGDLKGLNESDSVPISLLPKLISINSLTTDECANPTYSKSNLRASPLPVCGVKDENNLQASTKLQESFELEIEHDGQTHHNIRELYEKHFEPCGPTSGESLISEQRSMMPELIGDPRVPYKCNICNASFKLILTLQEHVECSHNDQILRSNYISDEDKSSFQHVCCTAVTDNHFCNNALPFRAPCNFDPTFNQSPTPIGQTLRPLNPNQQFPPMSASPYLEQDDMNHMETSSAEGLHVSAFSHQATKGLLALRDPAKSSYTLSSSNKYCNFLPSRDTEQRSHCSPEFNNSPFKWKSSMVYSTSNTPKSACSDLNILHSQLACKEQLRPQCSCSETVYSQLDFTEPHSSTVSSVQTPHSVFSESVNQIQPMFGAAHPWLERDADHSISVNPLQTPIKSETSQFQCHRDETYPLHSDIENKRFCITSSQLNTRGLIESLTDIPQREIASNDMRILDFSMDNGLQVVSDNKSCHLPELQIERDMVTVSAVSPCHNGRLESSTHHCNCEMCNVQPIPSSRMDDDFGLSNRTVSFATEAVENSRFSSVDKDDYNTKLRFGSNTRSSHIQFICGNKDAGFFNDYPVRELRSNSRVREPVQQRTDIEPLSSKENEDACKPDRKILLSDTEHVIVSQPSSLSNDQESYSSNDSNKIPHPGKLSVEVEHICKTCKKVFRNESILLDHIHEYTGKAPFKCCMCNNLFKTMKGLKLHLRWHTVMSKGQSYDTATVSSEMILCRPDVHIPKASEANKASIYDSKQLKEIDTSTKNVIKHNGDCNSMLPNNARNLLDHSKERLVDSKNSLDSSYVNTMKSPIPKSRTFQCQICFKRFPHHVLLRQHVKGMHKDSYFKCTSCNQSFLREQAWERHQALHRTNSEQFFSSTTNHKDTSKDEKMSIMNDNIKTDALTNDVAEANHFTAKVIQKCMPNIDDTANESNLSYVACMTKKGDVLDTNLESSEDKGVTHMCENTISVTSQLVLELGIRRLLPSLCEESMLLSVGWPKRNTRQILHDILQLCDKKPFSSECLNENCVLLFEVAIGEEASKAMLASSSVQEVVDKLLSVAGV